MKNKGFGHLKTRLFTIKASKHVGFGGSRNIYTDGHVENYWLWREMFVFLDVGCFFLCLVFF